MIVDLGKRMEAKIEKMQEMCNKDLEKLKNKQTEINKTITGMKNKLEGINSRITEAEERVSDLEGKIVEITTTEARKTTILQPVDQKPQLQKDREDEKAEGYGPDEGTRKNPRKTTK